MNENPTTDEATFEETLPESQWYAMLFPSHLESERLAAQLAALAGLTGGAVHPRLHVTVGYFTGEAAPDTVVALARELRGPAINVRAAGLFSWSERRHVLHGYSLSLQVVRDEALHDWQRRALDTFAGAGLISTFSLEDQNPHMAVLRDLPAPPAEVLVQLGSQDVRLEFRAARLVVSQRVGDGFVPWLDQPLED